MIIYTDRFLRNWQGGRQLWVLALIRPRHRGNQAITEHEREHIKQWWLTTVFGFVVLGFAAHVAANHLNVDLRQWTGFVFLPPSLHGILYLVFRPYRRWAEVRAYRVSVAYRPDQFENYSRALADHYRLGIDLSTARGLLK
jgi:hypothetical protein